MTLLETIETVQAETNSSFSRTIPNLQVGIDSTSLSAFKTCPRLYYYSIIQGYMLGTPGDQENPHLKFGTLFAQANEAYHHARANEEDHNKALQNTLAHVILESWDHVNNRPWISDEPTKTLKTLLRTIVMYFDHFENDPLETIILSSGKPATELSFRFSLSEILPENIQDEYLAPSGEPYVLCGHLDRAVSWNDELWIVDNKTTKSILSDQYFANYNPDNQVSLYAIAGAVVLHKPVEGVIIDAAQVQVNGSRFMRRPISRTPAQLEEWLVDLKFYLRMMEAYAKLNYWPMNDKACGMYGGCRFRTVCSADPSVREELLETFYTKRIWDPLLPR